MKRQKLNIVQSTAAYEDWLAKQFDKGIVKRDLEEKHAKMRKGPFPFLRATYWRWAETIFEVCKELKDAPAVLAVGDIHLENYGTWRDDESRLVWGVNDFDGAAKMPYAVDLVRLAASAILARTSHDLSSTAICTAIWDGYDEGLHQPLPFVLDEEHAWLRKLFIATEDDRAEFWQKMDELEAEAPDPRYRKAIEAALPEQNIKFIFARRTAGTGSLGRPRWVGIGRWHGGRLVREAKALVISGWTLAFDPGSEKLYVDKIASGSFRAPDPWYRVIDNVVVRRLSPNSHKIEVKHDSAVLLEPRMLGAMGHELANVHLGTGDVQRAVDSHFHDRDAAWLKKAAEDAAENVSSEYEEWMAS
jgi:hypothetical protein